MFTWVATPTEGAPTPLLISDPRSSMSTLSTDSGPPEKAIRTTGERAYHTEDIASKSLIATRSDDNTDFHLNSIWRT